MRALISICCEDCDGTTVPLDGAGSFCKTCTGHGHYQRWFELKPLPKTDDDVTSYILVGPDL